MALAMRTPAAGGDDEDFRRFEALFAAELDELQEHADDRGVSLDTVSRAYFVIVSGADSMVKHTELRDELNRDWRDAWEIASVLVDFGEAHLSKKDGWWWVIASEFIAKKCDKRSIGLKQYMEMRPDLVSFQDDVIQWYQTRQMNGNLQRRTMKEIKVTHGKRLQEQYYPDKPFKNYIESKDDSPSDRAVEEDDDGQYWTAEAPAEVENFHDHIIARYIKTAQDEIVEALDLSY